MNVSNMGKDGEIKVCIFYFCTGISYNVYNFTADVIFTHLQFKGIFRNTKSKTTD